MIWCSLTDHGVAEGDRKQKAWRMPYIIHNTCTHAYVLCRQGYTHTNTYMHTLWALSLCRKTLRPSLSPLYCKEISLEGCEYSFPFFTHCAHTKTTRQNIWVPWANFVDTIMYAGTFSAHAHIDKPRIVRVKTQGPQIMAHSFRSSFVNVRQTCSLHYFKQAMTMCLAYRMTIYACSI